MSLLAPYPRLLVIPFYYPLSYAVIGHDMVDDNWKTRLKRVDSALSLARQFPIGLLGRSDRPNIRSVSWSSCICLASVSPP